MLCKTWCGLWRAFLVLAAVSAIVSSAQLVKDDLMVVIPTGMPNAGAAEDVRPATELHRRLRNATRSAATLRRTSTAVNPHPHYQTASAGWTPSLDVPDGSEPTVARVKKKIKHKRTWDEPEAQASSEAQQSTVTSKRPDRVKTRRRLVSAASSSSTVRTTLRSAVAAAAALQEDPYYDFGKKIKLQTTSTSPSSAHGLNAVDLETRTSVRSPIVVATGTDEDADRNNGNAATTTGSGRTRTSSPPLGRGHNATSGARRPPENQAECAYPRFTRRNKTRPQRDARCLPEPAADAARTTRILSTVVTSVSSVKGGNSQQQQQQQQQQKKSNDTEAVAVELAAPEDRPTVPSSTLSPVEPAVSGYPKYLRNRYRNISLPEYLEITKVNQRLRLNGSTVTPTPSPSPPTTEAAQPPSSAEQVTPPSSAADPADAPSTSPADGAAETVDVPNTTTTTTTTTTTITTDTTEANTTDTTVIAADRLHHLRSPSPPTDLQDFIYLNNGTSETPPTGDDVEARHHKRPSLLQPRNVTRASVEHDVAGVVYPDGLAASTYLLTFLAVVPLVLVIVFAFKLAVQRKRKKKVFDSSEYSSEYNRSPLDFNTVTSSPITTKLPRVPQHIVQWDVDKQQQHQHLQQQQQHQQQQQQQQQAAGGNNCNGRWEFPRDKLRLQTILGQGNFGQVWKAEADDISGHEGLTRLVAVKMVKEDAASREREDLIRELSIMQHLGSHPNVVTLLGCCTEKEPYLLIMEYVMYGKLLAFLRDRRTRSHYFNFSDSTASLTSRDLTVFAYCVARGMDFLVSKKIVHRDLAARNVLVDHNKLCKIADFGMSRNVRDTNQIYEQRHTKGALPIRWMAPESLHYSIFTYKTDVWSFGVLMWEIVTLGSTPYCTMGAREVMRRVREGYRLDKPAHCRSELFRVITKCWAADPAKRPTFADLKQELGALLENPEFEGSYVDLESLVDESDGGAKDRQQQ